MTAVVPLIPKRTTARSTPGHHGDCGDLGGRDVGVERGRARGVRVLEDAERVARDEQEGVGGEPGIDRGDGGEIESRDGLLATLVELAVEIADHLVVERVDLLLVGLRVGSRLPIPVTCSNPEPTNSAASENLSLSSDR